MTSAADIKKSADVAQFRSAPADEAMLRERIEGVLRGIYDPEIPVNIFELGLIYSLEASADGVVDIKMTPRGVPEAHTT